MKKSIPVFVVIIVAGLAAYTLSVKSISGANTPHEKAVKPVSASLNSSSTTTTMPSEQSVDIDLVAAQSNDFESQIIERLKAEYQNRIIDLSVQASLIEVKQRILNQFPENGSSLFNRIMLIAFPAHANSIFRLMEGLEKYQDWLTDQYLYLEGLSPLARNGALWKKRIEIFGNDAQLIWQDEKNTLAQSKLRMQEVLHQLDRSFDMSMDEKLFQLRSAIQDNLSDSVRDAAIDEGVISRAFFNLTSVQQDLASLPAEERQIAIDTIRRQLGYSEEQIETLAIRDQKRAARWQNGMAYMEAREQLVKQLEGDQLQEALRGLRKKFFKHEALTIQKEEEMDFWRFKRPRKFGNN